MSNVRHISGKNWKADLLHRRTARWKPYFVRKTFTTDLITIYRTGWGYYSIVVVVKK